MERDETENRKNEREEERDEMVKDERDRETKGRTKMGKED